MIQTCFFFILTTVYNKTYFINTDDIEKNYKFQFKTLCSHLILKKID